jgi:hypothetical protein
MAAVAVLSSLLSVAPVVPAFAEPRPLAVAGMSTTAATIIAGGANPLQQPCAKARKAVQRAEAAMRGPVYTRAEALSRIWGLERAKRQRGWLCAPMPATCADATSAEEGAGIDVDVANAMAPTRKNGYDASDVRVAGLALWAMATTRDALCGADGT